MKTDDEIRGIFASLSIADRHSPAVTQAVVGYHEGYADAIADAAKVANEHPANSTCLLHRCQGVIAESIRALKSTPGGGT